MVVHENSRGILWITTSEALHLGIDDEWHIGG